MDKKYAYITLLSNDDFVAGVHLLKYSLDAVGTAYPLLCMVTDNVSDSTLYMLGRLGITVIHVPTIEMPELIDQHNSRLNADQAARWRDTFTKYHIFRFTEYDKLIFLDADLYFLKNTDYAFELPHMTAALDGEMFNVHPGNPHFNGGFMVIQPNAELFDQLVNFLNRVDPLYFDGLVADQEVLNFFYSDWPKHPELHLDKYHNIFAPYCQEGIVDETLRKDAISNAVFYHFTGKKPWEHWNRDCWGVPEFQFLRPLIDQLEEDRKKLTRVKTCVYTICKNEEKNVEKWYQTVKEADAICVIDTGSTDSTWSKLLSCGDNMYIDKYEYDGEFDFSKARNFSLEKARDVCKLVDDSREWIFITVDLDEFLVEYAIDHIKTAWRPEYDTMKLHCIKDGQTGVAEHKIHSDDNWSWHRSIHEIPQLKGKKRCQWVCGDICTAYEHIQDTTKERDYYTLLKREHDREPNNATTLVYLAWEAINHEDWDNVLKYSEDAIVLITEDEGNELYQDYQSLIQCYLNCADFWKAKDDPENQFLAFNAAIEVIENDDFCAIRKPYILRGDLKEATGDHIGAISDYLRALDVTTIPYCWVDDEEFYNNDQIFNRLTMSYYHAGDLDSALLYANRTLEVFDGLDFYHTNKELIENEIKARNVSTMKSESVSFDDSIDMSEQADTKHKKICVYAICKNEAQNVSAWIDSMSEADYIVVLDTGSTDGTFELLKQDPRVTTVKQKVYDTWRFDTARNDALLLVPSDTTIFVSTDLDERFEQGWAEVLQEEWKENTTRAWYTFVWSHNESGMPGRVYSHFKIHGVGYKWIYPVHEQLTAVDVTENAIDLTSRITIHHWPVGKESRSSYLHLLELRVSEDDGTDIQGKLYLTHEYYYRGMYDECIKLGKSIVDDSGFDSLEKANILLFIGNALRDSGQVADSIGYYFEAIETDRQYREPYCALAKIFNAKKNWKQTILLLETALDVTCRRESWLEQDTAWCGEVEDLLSLAYFYNQEYGKGYVKLLQALKLDPNNDRYIYNIKWFEDKLKI